MRKSRRLVAIWLTAAIAAGAHVVATAEATSAPPDSTDPVATSEPVTEPVVVEPVPPTPWSEAIDAEGDADVDAALALFNIAFGPIDGLPPPPEDSGVQGDVTVAYRAVLRVWDELTPAQRAAIQSASRRRRARRPRGRGSDPVLLGRQTRRVRCSSTRSMTSHASTGRRSPARSATSTAS